MGDEDEALGWAIDVERLQKRRKLEQEAAERGETGEDDTEEGLLAKLKKRDADGNEEEEEEEDELDDEADSMLEDSDSEAEDDSDSDAPAKSKRKTDPPKRASSPAMSTATTTATNLDISPEFLKQKFPAVFDQVEMPKVLVTTSLNSTLHKEAQIVASLFPNSVRKSS